MRLKFLMILFCTLILSAQSQAANLVVDGNTHGQTWEGWGTTAFSFDSLQLEPEANTPGTIPIEGRNEILKLYYRELGMTRIRICPTVYEPENDNDNPFVLNPSGFVWKGQGARPLVSLDPYCEDHLVIGRKYRTSREPFIMYPGTSSWEKWMTIKPDSPTWFWGPDAKFNHAMVDEYAEHALAGILHVKEAYHYEIPAWSLFNEPTNTAKIDKETTLALVLACGRRFAEYKLKTKLVICDDVTPEASAATIEYVLANEEARKYIGAVSYHRYCGDFVLERVKPMLAKIDKGELLVSHPVSFYESAVKYGKSVWLSEQCSYGDEGITYFDAGRARSNHICDEINYGKVNTFDFMLPYFIERGRPGNEECPIFIRFKDGKYASCEINPIGSWISHFTRYIRPGAVQLGVNADDKLIKAVAFRHAKNKTLTVVVINNHPDSAHINIRLDGFTKLGKAQRIRTSPNEFRKKLIPLKLAGNSIADDLPVTSVTTYILLMSHSD